MKKGFTLIELLVVIAIIGLLATIAIVNLNSARAKAKKARFFADLRNVQTAAILCHDKGEELMCGNGYSEFCTPLVNVCGSPSNSDPGTCSGVFNYPQPGASICSGSETNWPSLPGGWKWDDWAPQYVKSDLDNYSFSIYACDIAGTFCPPGAVGCCNGMDGFACTELGCGEYHRPFEA